MGTDKPLHRHCHSERSEESEFPRPFASLRVTVVVLRLLLLGTAALLLAGCGISLGGGNSSELFSELEVKGEAVVGAEMTVEVTHEQRYPVAVDISCFLVEPGHSRRLLGRDALPPNPDTSAEPTPVPGDSTFRFRVQRPGRYVALCNTPLDPENFISKQFRVK